VRELYNFASKLNEEDSANTKDVIEELKETVKGVKDEYKLPSFTSFIKRTKKEDDSQRQPSKRYRGDGSAGDQLQAHGYKVVPETFEDESGGLWEPLVKV
jgi:hypothetical protein